MKLADDWKTYFHHYSTWALSALTGLGGVWATLPDEVKAGMPGWARTLVCWLIFSVALAGLTGKFIDQTPKQ